MHQKIALQSTSVLVSLPSSVDTEVPHEIRSLHSSRDKRLVCICHSQNGHSSKCKSDKANHEQLN